MIINGIGTPGEKYHSYACNELGQSKNLKNKDVASSK
jgi:hypothetical protein